jgi:delta 1-pyrroline-5-carboxylate dehydrogenase
MTASQSIVPLIEVVDFACGIAQLTKGENLPRIADGLDGETMREPIGVCAGITPFNFPAMVPMWMFPLAIACGITFVLKPSEKVPLTANRLAQLLSPANSGSSYIVSSGRDCGLGAKPGTFTSPVAPTGIKETSAHLCYCSIQVWSSPSSPPRSSRAKRKRAPRANSW